MRFSTMFSLAFTLAAAVSALPAASPNQGLAAHDDNLNVYERSATDDLYTRSESEFEGSILDARAKFKASKIDLGFNKKLTKGTIAQDQREGAEELAKKAMFQADVTDGEVVFGWHDENTEDPVEHFTRNPASGPDASKGKIHIHRDGSWTQRKEGAANKGDG